MIDKNFQDTVLACLVGVPEFAAVGCQYLSEKEFEGPLQANLAKMAIDFFNRYDTTITRPARGAPTGFQLTDTVKIATARKINPAAIR